LELRPETCGLATAGGAHDHENESNVSPSDFGKLERPREALWRRQHMQVMLVHVVETIILRIAEKKGQRQKRRGSDRKEALRTIVNQQKVPGILAYSDEQPIGWCSIAPREEFHRLERSRTLKRIDNEPVWSVVCFFVAKPFRGKGVSTRLLEAAVKYAREQGAKIIEGYPTRSSMKQQDTTVYTGLASMFLKVGFTDCGSSSKTRTIMRYKFEQ
jgi:GNAT superfamily N-acetyltransferase